MSYSRRQRKRWSRKKRGKTPAEHHERKEGKPLRVKSAAKIQLVQEEREEKLEVGRRRLARLRAAHRLEN